MSNIIFKFQVLISKIKIVINKNFQKNAVFLKFFNKTKIA